MRLYTRAGGLELLAQLAEVAIDGPLQRVAARQAGVQQLGARVEAHRGLSHVKQQAELGQGQGQPARAIRRVHRRGVIDGIDIERPGARHRRRVPARCAAQHGLGAGGHFQGVERFDDIIIRADPQRLQLVQILVQGRQHDHRGRAAPAELRQDLPAIQLGQPDVEQDDVGAKRLMQLDRRLAVSRRDGPEPFALQIADEDLRDLALVFNDQNQGVHGVSNAATTGWSEH